MQKRGMKLILACLAFLFVFPAPAFSEEGLKGINLQALNVARQCRDEIVNRFELLLNSGKLSVGQLFDTFYIPIPNTYPQKYHTQYDKYLDANLQGLLDSCLKKNKRFVFVVASDINGYIPTHNSKYTQPLTGRRDEDAKRNRAKIIFNDRTGLAASRNTSPYLLQQYSRDTGETMYDLSVPVNVRGQHWGCVRIGYK